jgi:adenylate kinase
MMKRDRSAWLEGRKARCAVPAPRIPRPWRLVLLGAPGIGKGTQAELLCQHLGTCHLSTGEVFRAAKCLAEGERSEALTAALDFMRRGELVPDDTVVAMVAERVRCLRCDGGFLLDGFPRTVAQAEALAGLLAAQGLALDGVLSYELPIEKVVERIGGRRTCSACGAIFHLSARPPRAAGICDACGAALYQRDDDRPEAIRVRLRAYDQSTAPLTSFYRGQGLLRPVQVGDTPDETLQRTLTVLNGAVMPAAAVSGCETRT